MLEYFTNEIIKSSFDNSAGTLLNKQAISCVVNSLINSRNMNKDNIDLLIAENESESGYMVKYADFNYVLKDYIIGDNLQYDDLPEKSEKDSEIIELLYGDFHAECGDR